MNKVDFHLSSFKLNIITLPFQDQPYLINFSVIKDPFNFLLILSLWLLFKFIFKFSKGYFLLLIIIILIPIMIFFNQNLFIILKLLHFYCLILLSVKLMIIKTFQILINNFKSYQIVDLLYFLNPKFFILIKIHCFLLILFIIILIKYQAIINIILIINLFQELHFIKFHWFILNFKFIF